MATLLQVEDLQTEIRLRSATVHALDGVNLAVEAGECLGIVGESGSGKTITALSIMQLLPPGGSSCMTDSAVIVLPLPDSPTMPRHSPGSRVRLTPDRA